MKNPLTPAGIEPATYRFVTQHTLSCIPYFNSRLQCSALCLCYFMRTMNYVGGVVLCVSSRQIGFSCYLRRKGSVMVPFGKCALLWNGKSKLKLLQLRQLLQIILVGIFVCLFCFVFLFFVFCFFFLLVFGCWLYIFVMFWAAFLALLEWRVFAYIHVRRGPYTVAFVGVLQPFLDALRLFSRE